MKRHLVDCQRFQNISDVYLGTTRDAEMYMWKVQVDKILEEHEDLFPRSRVIGKVRALIESIHDKEEWALPWQFEHAL